MRPEVAQAIEIASRLGDSGSGLVNASLRADAVEPDEDITGADGIAFMEDDLSDATSRPGGDGHGLRCLQRVGGLDAMLRGPLPDLGGLHQWGRAALRGACSAAAIGDDGQQLVAEQESGE